MLDACEGEFHSMKCIKARGPFFSESSWNLFWISFLLSRAICAFIIRILSPHSTLPGASGEGLGRAALLHLSNRSRVVLPMPALVRVAFTVIYSILLKFKSKSANIGHILLVHT